MNAPALGNANASITASAVRVEQFVKMGLLETIWNAIKDLFSAPLTPQAIYTRMAVLRNELLGAMGDSCSHMPPQVQLEFAKRATAMVHDVLVDCMSSMMKNHASRSSLEVREAAFHRAADRARVIVDLHLQRAQMLDQPPGAPRITSVFVENPIGPHLPKVERLLLVRAAPPIENLVLRGGGTKGLGNPPALRALENLGRLAELKKVVGTSAGALTAVCLASGMSAGSFQRLSSETDANALLNTPENFAQRYPQVKFGWLGYNAGTALETLDRASSRSVTNYLRDHWEDVVNTPQWAGLDAADHRRLENLRDQVFEQSPRTGRMITFHDLHLLHQLAPARFKELVLTGYNMDEKQTVHFSAATHRDMPVALAGRISMGIPGVFAPVNLGVEDGNGRAQRFVDGGVGSNMPSEAVLDGLHGAQLADAAAKTLLLTYDEGGKAYSILHGSPARREEIAGGLVGNLLLNKRMDAAKVHFSGGNVLPVFHGRLGTLSFWALKATVEQAQTQSMLKTLEYIDNTMGQARHDTVPDAAAAARLLSAHEQQRFLQAHGDDIDPLHMALCGAIRAQLYPPAAAAAAAA